MIDRRTTYIDPAFTLLGFQPKIVEAFRQYKTENGQHALISDDGKLMVKQGYLNVSYAAYVLGHGPILGANLKPKRLRNVDRACTEALALLRLIQSAQ